MINLVGKRHDWYSGHRFSGYDRLSGKSVRKNDHFRGTLAIVLFTGFEDKKGLTVFPLNRSLTILCWNLSDFHDTLTRKKEVIEAFPALNVV